MYEYETESVLQGRSVDKKSTIQEIDMALAVLEKAGAQLFSMTNLVKRARQFNKPQIYDSLYAALAELRGCEFWTADKRFYDAVKSRLPFVKYLTQYT